MFSKEMDHRENVAMQCYCSSFAILLQCCIKLLQYFFLILLQYYYNVVAVFLRYYCSTINTIAVVSRCYCVYLWERVGHKPGLRRTWTLVGTWLQLGRRGNGTDVPEDLSFYISQSIIFKRCKMPFAKCYWLFLRRIESDTGVLKDSLLLALLLWLYLVFHPSLKVKVLPSHIWQNNFSWTWKLSRSSEFHRNSSWLVGSSSFRKALNSVVHESMLLIKVVSLAMLSTKVSRASMFSR